MKKHRSWAFYGRAGTGKTTLAGTFPGPILLVDINDEGTDSVSDVKGIRVTEPKTWDDLVNIYWHLKNNPGKYGTVVFDTMTQIQQLIVEEISGVKANKSGKQAGDWGTMTKQDWGEVSSRMKSWITDIKELPLEVVFIAQDRTFNTETEEGSDDGAIDPEIGPRLSPSISSHLCAAVSVVGNTFIRDRVVKLKVKNKVVERTKKEYCIRLGPNAYYITKIRKPRSIEMPEFLVNPTYETMLEIITGE